MTFNSLLMIVQLKMHKLTTLFLLFTICDETMSKNVPLVQELPSTGGSEAVKHPTHQNMEDISYHGNGIIYRSKKVVGEYIGYKEYFGYSDSCLRSNSSLYLVFIAIIAFFSLV